MMGWRSAGMLTLLTALVVLAGCDDGAFTPPMMSGGGGGGAALALMQTSPPSGTSLSAGTPVTFQATLTQTGQPVSGATIFFSASPTGVGQFIQSTVQTDAQGVAEAVFNIATMPATLRVTVTANAMAQGQTRSVNIQISP